MNNKYIHIEEDFEHCGYRCLVVVNAMCIRCGYVGIPKTHPDYKKSYCKIDEKYYVHGGITYSDKIEYIGVEPNDLWYFGFDCGHCYDMYAVDDALKYGLNVAAETARGLREINKTLMGHKCSKEYVKQECISLAEQLKEVENNDEKRG